MSLTFLKYFPKCDQDVRGFEGFLDMNLTAVQ